MSKAVARPSLLHLLTLPFVALVLMLAAAVGVLSYRAGSQAVDDASARLLQQSVLRVAEAVDRHAAEAKAVLDAVEPAAAGLPAAAASAPSGAPAAAAAAPQAPPAEVPTDAKAVARRLQAAMVGMAGRERIGSLHLAYRNGPLATLRPQPDGGAEFGWKLGDAAAWSVQRLDAGGAPAADLPTPGNRPDLRQLPWYRAALAANQPVWPAVEIDVRTQELVATLARRIPGSTDGAALGVVAADLPLRSIDSFLRGLGFAEQGFAFVVEPGGRLVASSHGATVRRGTDGSMQRVSASQPDLPLLAAVYVAAQPHLGGSSLAKPGIVAVEGPAGEPLMAGFARLAGGPVPDWMVVVAMPRGDVMAGISANLARTLAAGLLAAAVVLIAGALVMRRVTRDVRAIAEAARRIGEGDLETPVGEPSTAELDALAESFRRMQHRLRTDRVTGLANREAVLTRLHDRMRPGRRQNDGPLLAMLFVDLDRFKTINERFGHEAGDAVLATLGRRLRQTVRDTDLVARWAGDEFVLLLDGVASAASAEQVREQVERVLRDPVEFAPGKDAVELVGTVGLAVYPGDAQEPEDLLRAADEDMLRRKPASVSQW